MTLGDLLIPVLGLLLGIVFIGCIVLVIPDDEVSSND